MTAVYDPETGGTAATASLCVDQFEFPNLSCEYPVVWVRASEARALCGAIGKRLCDAHEWEGACAGRLLDPRMDYGWDDLPAVYASGHRRERRMLMEYRHNEEREVLWAYGKHKDHAKCATGARKDPRCTVVDWGICATNSYPAGAFPECVSPFGAYDLHGNVAEHMSLPLYPEELGVAAGVGWTEMKGSWFLFAREETHPDECRWRARNWHTTRTDHWNSHRNYHLGFRCCKDVPSTL
jgi:formylglycine-generating enzyme required for sulfatase activity